MDLLGDIGTADQLTSTRAENAVLQERVKQLTSRVKVLTIENETLKAEVELYRTEAATCSLNRLGLGDAAGSDTTTMEVVQDDPFVRSGNGVFPKNNEITVSNWHGNANPLCCTLSIDDALLAAGGANNYLNILPWGLLDGKHQQQQEEIVASKSVLVHMEAPVICTSFSPYLSRHGDHVVAAGCMDGKFQLIQVSQTQTRGLRQSSPLFEELPLEWQHQKYVRALAFSPTKPLMATASADGTVKVFDIQQVSIDDMDDNDNDETNDISTRLSVKLVERLNLPGAVESLVWTNDDKLICYARGTPYLSVFDLGSNNFTQTRLHLNSPNGNTVDDHVSFAVMDLNLWNHNGGNDKYVVAATDANRNIVIDVSTGVHVRNLYGHANDGYSQPKAVWSCNGQYVIGNTQNDGSLCLWDVASSRMVETITNAHANPVRNLYSSRITDTLLTTSFDKQTKLWFAS